MTTASTEPTTERHVQLHDVLAPEIRGRLAEWARSAVERLGSDPSWYGTATSASPDPLDLDHELRTAVADAIVGLVPLVRRELGVPRFPLGSIEFVVCVHHPEGTVHGPPGRADDPGERHIDFVYQLDPASPFGGVAAAANSIVFFPSAVHHEISRVNDPDSAAALVTLRGWITSTERPAPSTSAVAFSVRRSQLQCRYLPKLSASGFEIRPTPTAVHELLRALLDLRGGRRRPEHADPVYHLADDNDVIDVSDVAGDVLGALQPLHERFAGVPLVPTAMFGLRSYRAGARLAMHVDRIETHIVSSVIQVAQDVDEVWPLQLDVDGRIEEIVLNPGQMVHYEGASTMHGRVTPLNGRSFTNVFVHYRPVDWDWTEAMIFERAAADGS
jgi:hypothetical protein